MSQCGGKSAAEGEPRNRIVLLEITLSTPMVFLADGSVQPGWPWLQEMQAAYSWKPGPTTKLSQVSYARSIRMLYFQPHRGVQH